MSGHEKCDYCGSDVDQYNAVVVGKKLAEANSWYGWSRTDNSKWVSGLGNVVVLDAKVTWDSGDLDSDWFYGELPQGTEFETHIIFKVIPPGKDADNPRYYKRTGRGDSYGSVEWDIGEFYEVQPVEQRITVYEKGE